VHTFNIQMYLKAAEKPRTEYILLELEGITHSSIFWLTVRSILGYDVSVCTL